MKSTIKDILIPHMIIGGILFSMIGLPMLVYNIFWMFEYDMCIKSGGDPVQCAKELKGGR